MVKHGFFYAIEGKDSLDTLTLKNIPYFVKHKKLNLNLQEDPNPFPQKMKPKKRQMMYEISKYRVILPGK